MNKCSLQFGISSLNICSKMSLSLIFLFMLFITCWDSNIKLIKRWTILTKSTVNLQPNLCVQSTQNTTCSMLGNRVLSRYNIGKPCNYVVNLALGHKATRFPKICRELSLLLLYYYIDKQSGMWLRFMNPQIQIMWIL